MAKSESVKVTYSLPEDLVGELREAVRHVVRVFLDL